jgi:succinate dehydrogenase / fumarate reductase cytochrome b subunit
MAMSITHRITGVGLYAGTALLAWYLLALASGPEAFATASAFFGSFFGRLILFGFSWALFHHLAGGLRHAIWDTGRGFEPEERELLAKATLVGGITLTIVVWIIAYIVR